MSKGGEFERQVCKRLSLWWTNGVRDDVFWRSSTSGARATSRRKKGLDTANSHGDVMALDPIGAPLLDLVTIEIKRGYNRCTLQDLIDQPDDGKQREGWRKWIAQAMEAYRHAGSISWMVIARRDSRTAIVVFPATEVTQELSSGMRKITVAAERLPILHCVALDSFLKIDPKMIRKVLSVI